MQDLDARNIFVDRQGKKNHERDESLNSLQSYEKIGKNEQSPDPKIDIRDIYQIEGEETIRANDLNSNLKIPETNITHDEKRGPSKAILYRGGKAIQVKGGLDFTNALYDKETGRRCIEKEEEIESLERAPILQCNHK